MQVAIVTGATGGIGFGSASKFAEPGMAVLDHRGQSNASTNWRQQ